jgi:hypothetical protein
MQHEKNEFLPSSNDSGKKQIGHSPKWVLSGWVNNSLSCNSFLQALLCFDRCSLWHSTPQYLTSKQAHRNNFTLSTSAAPQLAQHMPASASAAAAALLLIIIYYVAG